MVRRTQSQSQPSGRWAIAVILDNEVARKSRLMIRTPQDLQKVRESERYRALTWKKH